MHIKYKIISFDLWGTLFESNKNFKTARAKILADILVKHKIFTVKEIDTIDISGILGHIKKDIDKIVAQYGVSITSFELYSAFLQTIINKNHTVHTKILSNLNFESIVQECIEQIEILLLNTNYQPCLIEGNIKHLLHTLQTQGVKLVIMSNTMYMSGTTIKKLLREKLGSSIFSQFLFSDEVGFSKPSPIIYEKLITYAMGEGIQSNEILHIGDNFITDGGVKIYGMNFIQVLSESKNTLEQILINITTYNSGSGNDKG